MAGLEGIIPFLLWRLMLHPGDQHRYHRYRNACPHHSAYSSACGYLHRDRYAGHRKHLSCAEDHTVAMRGGQCVPTPGRFYRNYSCVRNETHVMLLPRCISPCANIIINKASSIVLPNPSKQQHQICYKTQVSLLIFTWKLRVSQGQVL